MFEIFNSLYSITTYFIFSLIRFVWYKCRKDIWNIRDVDNYANDYETSAIVEHILWRSRLSVYHNTANYHFLGYFQTLDHPKRALNDNVVLMYVNSRLAFFLEMDHSVWRYAADKTPFLWYTLFKEAKRCITMPLASLHRLADSLPDSTVPSLIISNQGRCGSTLLCKLIQLADNGVLTLSEPDTFASLMQMLPQRKVLDEEFYRIVRSTVRIQFKPVSKAKAVVIKDRLIGLRIVKHICKICPDVKHVYVKRANVLKTITSWQTAFMYVGEVQCTRLLAKFNLLKPLLPYLGQPYVGQHNEESSKVMKNALKYLRMGDVMEFMLFCWAENAAAYADACKTVPFLNVDYEKLLKQPDEVLNGIFRLIDVRPANLKYALKVGFREDSQKGTPLAWEYSRSRKPIKYTADMKKRADLFLNSLGLNSINFDG